MSAVLEAEALSKRYRVSAGRLGRHALVHALEDVSLALDAGRTLAVVGESGCGKSTLARQITMLETPSAGRLRIGGVDVAGADAAARRTLRRAVQMVFQNPYASLNPRKRIGDALAEPLAIATALGRAERGERAREMLARVGLRPEHDRRYPHMFSGGLPYTHPAFIKDIGCNPYSNIGEIGNTVIQIILQPGIGIGGSGSPQLSYLIERLCFNDDLRTGLTVFICQPYLLREICNYNRTFFRRGIRKDNK